MERGRVKTLFVDVGQCPHDSAISREEQMEVLRMLAVFRQHRNRVDTRSIVMKLALDSAVLPRVKEIPITSGAAVVSPMWNRRHVSDNRVYCDFSFIGISEVLAPRVDLLLTGGVPRHFTAERIRFRFPMVGSRLHRSLKLRCLV